MTIPVLLTEPEAAERLKVCARTLRKARDAGRLTYVLIGRRILYTPEDLQRFIAESTRQGNPMPKTTPTRRTATKAGTVVPFSARP